jgi:hypothetical protein
MRSRTYVAGLLSLMLMSVGMAVGAAQDLPEAQAQRIENEVRSRGLSEDLGTREVVRIIRGFAVAPVPLNLRGKDLLLVGLGSYLVNAAGGCNDCHTSPSYESGGDPFLGQPKRVNADRYLAGGTPFGPPGDPNTPVSRNLTPRSNGRPANLTFQQFRQVMRTGVDLKNRLPHVPSESHDLLQVMPWPVYQDLTERDIRAMYEYLRAIPSLPSAP